MEILFLLLGLVGLWFGAELVVNGAVDIARRYNFSHAFVGLTILSIGTNVPELFVMVTGTLDRLNGIETSGLLVGHIVGSSISQITLIAGIAAFFVTLNMTEKRMYRDGAALIGSTILLFLLAFDGGLSRIDGMVLLLVYGLYFIFLWRGERTGPRFHKRAKYSFLQAGMLLGAGLVLLHFASEATVQGGLAISQQWDVAPALVGILFVGLGTSLPELATAISAGRNNAGSMAIGNIIGATVFDVLFVTGIGAVISELVLSPRLRFFDLPYLMFAAVLLITLVAWKSDRLSKKEGLILIGAALLYALLTFSDLLVRGFGLLL